MVILTGECVLLVVIRGILLIPLQDYVFKYVLIILYYMQMIR